MFGRGFLCGNPRGAHQGPLTRRNCENRTSTGFRGSSRKAVPLNEKGLYNFELVFLYWYR